MKAAVWFLRFPGAARNAGPFRFAEPLDRRQFAHAMRRRFGLDQLPAQTKLWAGTAENWEQALRGGADRRLTQRQQLLARRQAGESLRAIAARVGLSHERVRQLTQEETS